MKYIVLCLALVGTTQAGNKEELAYLGSLMKAHVKLVQTLKGDKSVASLASKKAQNFSLSKVLEAQMVVVLSLKLSTADKEQITRLSEQYTKEVNKR